jgi:hypothetical protein
MQGAGGWFEKRRCPSTGRGDELEFYTLELCLLAVFCHQFTAQNGDISGRIAEKQRKTLEICPILGTGPVRT